MFHRYLLIVAAGAFAAGGCGDSGPQFKSNCVAQDSSAEATIPAQRNADGSVILPDGRKINPAGQLLTIGGFPLQLRVLPQENGRYVVVTDGDYGDEHLRIIDTQATDDTAAIVSNVDYPRSSDDAKAPALFYGLALSPDGTKLYVSNGAHDPLLGSEPDQSKHYNVIEVFDIAGSPPQLSKSAEIHLMFVGAAAPQARLPSGITLSSDGNTMYVACQLDGTLAVVDLAAGATQYTEIGRTMPLGTGPYDVALDETSHTAFVSLWGGYFVSVGNFKDGVVPVDVTNPMAPSPGTLIHTDKAPEQAIVVGGKVYVADADGDTVSAIDPASQMAALTPTAFDATGLLGSSPNALAADRAHDRLYVANAGENAVQAFTLSTMTPLGRVPTAWYPTAVAVRADGSPLDSVGQGARRRADRSRARQERLHEGLAADGADAVGPGSGDGRHRGAFVPDAAEELRGAARPARARRRCSRCRRRRARRRRSSTCSSSCAKTRPTTPCSAICRARTGAPTSPSSAATSRPTCTRSPSASPTSTTSTRSPSSRCRVTSGRRRTWPTTTSRRAG